MKVQLLMPGNVAVSRRCMENECCAVLLNRVSSVQLSLKPQNFYFGAVSNSFKDWTKHQQNASSKFL